jgi:TetR/AcrR family transcriptional regulator, regulator of cefoperazone and chloramphenicol sensitivity
VSAQPKLIPETDGARERLLDAATRLFAAGGYETATVRDIVSAAGTNLNAINYYFGGKRGLYQAVMLRELDRARSFTADLPRTAHGDALEHRLESVVLRILTFFVSQHSQLPRLAALEVVKPSAALDEIWPAIHVAERQELRDLVADVLGSEATADAIDEGVRAVYSQCVYFMFMGEVLQRAGSPVFSSSAAVRRLASRITVFSLSGLRALAESGD